MYRLIQKWIAAFAVLVAEFNAMRTALRNAGLVLHGAYTTQVTTADATNTATAITLANALKAAWNAHVASTAAHLAADATNVVSAADATDQTSANTLLNELKTDFNAHHDSATYHTIGGQGAVAVFADVSTADASNEGTSVTLANALKVAMNKHFASGFAAASATD